jgi:hypothetical protein
MWYEYVILILIAMGAGTFFRYLWDKDMDR